MISFENKLIHYKERTNSTMEDARLAIDSEWAEHGSVFAAGFQEDGRGRVPGRQWKSGSGENLLMTFLLDPGKISRVLPLPLLTGWALSNYIRETAGIETCIKWPNDLLAGESKISGILCESSRRWWLAGIGININQTDFKGDFRRPVSSMALQAGHPFDIGSILESFQSFYLDFLQTPPAADGFDKLLYHKGSEVSVILGDPETGNTIKGTITGIAPDGALLLSVDNGKAYPVYSGEIVYE